MLIADRLMQRSERLRDPPQIAQSVRWLIVHPEIEIDIHATLTTSGHFFRIRYQCTQVKKWMGDTGIGPVEKLQRLRCNVARMQIPVIECIGYTILGHFAAHGFEVWPK